MRLAAALPLAAALLAGCTQTMVLRVNPTPPTSAVEVDGDLCPSPCQKKLEFSDDKQTYQVAVSHKGYYPKEVLVPYDPQSPKTYEVALDKHRKEVSIVSDPEVGADVYLNGKSVGITPYKETLYFDQDQTYAVTLKRETYEDGTAKIAFEPEATTAYAIKLQKREFVELPVIEYQVEKRESGPKLIPTVKRAVSYLEVIERSPNVKSVTKVTNNADETVTLGEPVLSPDGRYLVYAASTKEPDKSIFSNLWRTEVGSPTKSKVTSGKYQDLNPCFDDKGEFLYFSSNRNTPQPSLWRVAATGAGGITKISNAQSEDFEPSASATLVAFTCNVPNAEQSQIWSVRKDGSLPTQLREGRSPDLSPDGRGIAFVKEDPRSGKSQIWLMDVDGSNETLLSGEEGVDDLEPRWAPDGRRIVFTSNAGRDSKQRPNLDVWVMDANGANRTQLTTNGSQDDKPRWDPAGRYIYFRSTRGGASNIWRFEMATAAPEAKPAN